MDRIESQVNALIRAIQSDERYLRYQTCRKSLENYPELIVRVCGFSARFTALSPEWQQEVLTRNFYE